MGCCHKKKPEPLLIKNTEKAEKEEKAEKIEIIENKNNIIEESNQKIEENKSEQNEQSLTVKVSYNDYKPLKLLGRGSFGEVLLVRLKATNKIYAMKILEKKLLKLKKQQGHTKTERDLMVRINCPFIVNIKTAFQDETNLYLVSEFMQGGDMFFHLHDGGIIIFNLEKTKFYIIELILALEFLHKNNMVYRDLKPENILLDDKGHIKLTDFGLSKILEEENDKAYTICGTPQYLAPEILLRQGYDKMIDWWSLGCIMYEMLTGRLPFAIKRGCKMSMKIYEKKVLFPSNINSNAKDLIEKLLIVNPKERLGIDGSESIKSHPFFEGVDWNLAYEKKLTPPFIPKLKSDTDLRYFDSIFTDEPIGGPKKRNNTRDREREISNEYNGFTYMAESVSKELNNLLKDDDPE